MTGFFGSLVNAAYYTVKAMSQDLPNNYDELLEAQRDRVHASTDIKKTAVNANDVKQPSAVFLLRVASPRLEMTSPGSCR